MTKARLFSYKHSQLYYKRYGIDPDKHFDLLCKRWGTDAAIEIVDGNMGKILMSEWENAGAENPFLSPT